MLCAITLRKNNAGTVTLQKRSPFYFWVQGWFLFFFFFFPHFNTAKKSDIQSRGSRFLVSFTSITVVFWLTAKKRPDNLSLFTLLLRLHSYKYTELIVVATAVGSRSTRLTPPPPHLPLPAVETSRARKNHSVAHSNKGVSQLLWEWAEPARVYVFPRRQAHLQVFLWASGVWCNYENGSVNKSTQDYAAVLLGSCCLFQRFSRKGSRPTLPRQSACRLSMCLSGVFKASKKEVT